MGLAILVLVGAAGLATVTGGSWARFATLRMRVGELVVVAVLAQLAGDALARLTGHAGWYAAGLAVSAIAALVFCVRNLRVAGLPLITIGLALNAGVVLLNAAMPVSTVAAARAHVGIGRIARGDDPRHEIANGGSRLRSLGDDIPVPLPWRPEVVSPGDVLVAAGLGELVLLAMRRRRAADERPDARPASAAAVVLT